MKVREQFKLGEDDWSNVSGVETVKLSDMGLVGKIKFNYNNLFVFLRYSWGIFDVAAVNYVNASGEDIKSFKQRSRALQMGVGYTFDFK